jgi:uncharacterized phage-associated protein
MGIPTVLNWQNLRRRKMSKQNTSLDVAQYFLAKALEDGELVSQLKMQKLVYYAYVWTLVRNGAALFEEPIEAWANGPVVPQLYEALRSYGSSPIDEKFLEGIESYDELVKKFDPEVLETLDEVYENYMTKTAFELVVMTHEEEPWKQARAGLGPKDRSSNKLDDKLILSTYQK